MVAEHADVWKIPGGDIGDAAARSAMLDRYCNEIGRNPATITRSIHLSAPYDHPDSTRKAIAAAVGSGFTHITLGLSAPDRDHVAQWVADELINH